MAKQRRLYKVAERIQEVLASALVRLSDPRLHLVTITSVVTSKDLASAKVFWTVMGDKSRREDAASGLSGASGLFRSAVARELGIRAAPEIRFYYDDTYDVQEEVAHLLKRIAVPENDTEVDETGEESNDDDTPVKQ